jgi:L-lactate dehydrogenase
MSHIVVVGTGAVGVAVATSILHASLASRLTLADMNAAKAEGEALDFAHAGPLVGATRVEATAMSDLVGGDLCILTAGAKQRHGETRLQLLARNIEAMDSIAQRLEAGGLPNVVLVVTNPVDVLTENLRRRWAGRGVHVLGSGTVLDTMRLRRELGARLYVAAESVHAWVVGEHGDSSVILADSARVAGIPLKEFWRRRRGSFRAEDAAELTQAVRGAAAEIIERKGATSHAIGMVTARIARAIVRNERAVLAVSAPVGPDVCAGVPSLVGRDGAEPVGLPEMSEAERAQFEASIGTLREAMGSLPHAS